MHATPHLVKPQRFGGLLPRAVPALLLVSSLLLAPHPAAAFAPEWLNPADPNLIGPPEELQPRVQFWIDALTRYRGDEVIVHDQDHPERILCVLSLPPSIRPRSAQAGRWSEDMEGVYARMFRDAAKALRAGEEPDLDERSRRFLEEPVRGEGLVAETVALANEAERLASAIRTQQGLYEVFADSYQRSGQYIDEVVRILTEEGVPSELAYLPHLESGYNPRAVSKVGAKGLWQFMESTGKLYLRVNDVVDERLDPYISTRAAARFLTDARATLGSWPLAISAYNHGIAGIQRARSEHGDDIAAIITEYDGPSMGFASRNFYVSFLAVVEVMQHADTYYAGVEPRERWAFDTVVPTSFVDAKVLAGHFGCTPEALAELNPALTRRVWAGERFIPPGVTVRVPRSEASATLAASLPEGAQHSAQRSGGGATSTYKVRRGDTLATIAARHRTSVAQLMKLNRLRNANEIFVGQKIRVPGRRS